MQDSSLFVSQILKEYFMDYQSHTASTPALPIKLETLASHLKKMKSKQRQPASSGSSAHNK